MDFEDLMELKVKDLIDNYAYVYNCYCGYVYGICKIDDWEDLYSEYDCDECVETFSIEPLISFEVLDSEVLSNERLKELAEHNGVLRRDYGEDKVG